MVETPPSLAARRPLRLLRVGFVGLLALALLALVLAEAVDILKERKAAQAAAEQRATDLATALAEHAGGIVREIDARLSAVAAEAALDPDPGRLHEVAKRHGDALTHVGSIIVLDAEGTPIADSKASPPRFFRPGTDPFFERLRDNPDAQLQIGRPLRSRFTDEWIIGLSRRVSNGEKFRGVVAASLMTERFRDVYARLNLGAGGSINLLREDGVMLMRQPHVESFIGTDLSRHPLFTEHLQRGDRGLYRGTSTSDGVVRFVAFERVPGLPLIVAVGLAEDEIFAPWREEALRRAAFLAVSALLLGAVAWFALRQIGAVERNATALAASEERFRDFADAASDWYWETGPDHALSELSRSVERFLGRPATHWIRRSRLEFQRPDEDPAAWLRHRADLEARRPFREFRYRVPAGDGGCRTISVSGRPRFGEDGAFLGYRGVGTDVTEQMEAEHRVKLAEDRLVQALDVSSDGCALVDETGRFAFVNRQYQRMNADLCDLVRDGATYESALRASIASGFIPEAVGREEDYVAERLRALSERTEPSTFKRRDRWLRFQAEPLPDGGAFLVFRDVTAEHDAGEQLRANERVAALQQFTGGVAHDFNNMLAVIMGNAALVREWVEGQPISERALDAVLNAARRGRDLTQRLLAYARSQTLEPAPIDIDALVRREAEALAEKLPGPLTLTASLRAEGWLVSVDRKQLRDVLASLALNAVDAMPQGGRLAIATAAVRLDAASAPPGCAPGDYVRLTVSDDGPGMPPEVATKAFEPFFTTKDVGGGSGLGLSMVEGFVRQSGGAVVLRTAPGEGAAFDLYFPRVEDAAARIGAA